MSPPVDMIAILRGITPARAPETGLALVDAGFRSLEVPLNSPDAFRSIELLARAHPECRIGAGTVLAPADVDRVRDAGGQLVVSPNVDGDVIRRAVSLDLRMLPGVATATEAFLALKAGASCLKLFPASTYGAGHLRALKSVLPAGVPVYPVGGIGPQDIATWLAAGADGFGFGSELFRPAYTLQDVVQRARSLFEALRIAKDSAEL